MKAQWRISLLLTLALGSAHPLYAQKLAGAGDGMGLLPPIMRGKDPGAAKKAVLHERNLALAAAAFGGYVKFCPDLAAPDAVSFLSRVAARKGMRDRAALILALRSSQKKGRGKQPVKGLAYIPALASAKDAASQQLAAAILATMYCQRYASDPAAFVSARTGQKTVQRAEAEVVQPKKKKKPGRKPAKGPIEPIPAALISSANPDTAALAAVAAAFSGDPAYREQMDALRNPTGTAAGALLLYLARQETPLSEQQVTGLFRAAQRTTNIFRREEADLLFSPMLPGGSLACMALAEIGDRKYLPLALNALGSRDGKVQVDAVRAIHGMGPDEQALGALSRLLQASGWPVLVEVCATLGAHPDKRMIPALMRRLERESGRFRLDLVHALSAIAGEQKGATAAEWKQWWTAEQARFQVDPAASQAYRETTPVQYVEIPALGYFYGLPIFSDRLVYVVDTSLSMKGERIASLRENLVESLNSLSASGGPRSRGTTVEFNIVDFGGDVVTMAGGGLTSNFKTGRERAEDMPMTVGTRSYDAIERAMLLPGMDTIYFLSDGAPIWGQIEAWSSIHAAMDLLMLHAPVAIWSVAFDPSGGNAGAMTLLSGENYGRYEAPAF